MRILCICYEYPPVGGGGASFCEGICEAFVRAGHDVDVVTSGMRDLPVEEERNGVLIHRARCLRRHAHYSTTLELATQVLPAYRLARKLYDARRHDIAHCHFVVPSGVSAWLLHRRTGLPYVITAHGSDIPGYNADRFHLAHRLIRPAWSRIIRAGAALITPSHFLADLIRRQIDTAVEVIPYGFDTPAQSERNPGERLLVVTRMFERKGVQFLIRALEGVDTDWEIVVAGDGPYLPTVKSLADEVGVSARFLGMVPRDELRDLYLSSKIFVFPSIQENFPVVLLEAMAAGCAVITTSALGCAEVVGDAAIKVEPESVDGVRDAVQQLLGDPERIERLSEAGRRRIESFVWPRIVGEYETLFHRVLEAEAASKRVESARSPRD